MAQTSCALKLKATRPPRVRVRVSKSTLLQPLCQKQFPWSTCVTNKVEELEKIMTEHEFTVSTSQVHALVRLHRRVKPQADAALRKIFTGHAPNCALLHYLSLSSGALAQAYINTSCSGTHESGANAA